MTENVHLKQRKTLGFSSLGFSSLTGNFIWKGYTYAVQGLIWAFAALIFPIKGLTHGWCDDGSSVSSPISPHSQPNVQSTDLSEDVLTQVLNELKTKSPTVHEDALRVWKNFTDQSGQPNYVYRFWARDLIDSLRRKNVVFDDESKVAAVFKKLFDRQLISEYAVVTLTRDSWGYLVHREGIPGWKHKDLTPKSHIPAVKTPERSV